VPLDCKLICSIKIAAYNEQFNVGGASDADVAVLWKVLLDGDLFKIQMHAHVLIDLAIVLRNARQHVVDRLNVERDRQSVVPNIDVDVGLRL